LPNIIAIVVFNISLSKKVGHSLKRTSNILNITIEEFICAEEEGYHEVAIPQARISRNIGTVWNYHGREGFH